ncbi:hypothetical protein HMPREF3201_02460, partial [Megasphaera sp. MJR8396C]
PREGAWIETTATWGLTYWEDVAPREGAWIETSFRKIRQLK